MAEQHPTEGAGSSGASGSNSDSTVELNIKTLDSQIYKFHVDKNVYFFILLIALSLAF